KKLELLRQYITKIEVRNLEAIAEIVKLKTKFKSKIKELEKSRADSAIKNT
ncbi:400_t:CDS:2, partial [Gigaspora margarita]